MTLNDLRQSDIQKLAELLSRSQQSRERKALCIELEIDHKRLNFIENISDRDFFLRLISYLKETGNKDALCNLCSEQALPNLQDQQNRNDLIDIIKRLGCEQSTATKKSIRILRKKIFLFVSTSFLIALASIAFSVYNPTSPAIILQNSPAIAVFNDKLYIAFKANDTLNQLYITSLDNENSNKNRPVAIRSTILKNDDDPAMTVFKNKLYIAFRDNKDKSNQLYVASSEDGRFLEHPLPYPDILMGGNPAMAVFKNKLYIAFKANDKSNQLYVASSEDGRFLEPATGYPDILMGGNPAMAVFRNKLYIAFKANDKSNQLYVASSNEEGSFLEPAEGSPDIQIDSAPAMAVFKNKLYIVFNNASSSELCLVPQELELFTSSNLSCK